MSTLRAPFNLSRWIEENRELLRPPVSNQQVWEGTDLIVMIVGGGNVRTDYHDDPRGEFFHQLVGDMTLRVMPEDGGPAEDLTIAEGDVFYLPPHVRHSPQRPDPDSIGLVVEIDRVDGEIDGFEWFCPECNSLIHRTEVQLASLVTDLPPLFEAFYGDEAARTCERCGAVHPDGR
jgi:3-hydroxyanthranilate 3,4-dioxygenase